MPTNLPWGATLLLALFFGIGGTGILAVIARPAKDTIEDLRGEIDKLRTRMDGQDKKIEELQRDNSLKGRFNTAISMHADELRRRLLKTKPAPEEAIDTSAELMEKVRHAFEAEEAQANQPQGNPPPNP